MQSVRWREVTYPRSPHAGSYDTFRSLVLRLRTAEPAKRSLAAAALIAVAKSFGVRLVD
jgi:hypothetical protein